MKRKKRKNKKSKLFAYFVAVSGFMLLGTASWAFYNFLNAGIGDLLRMWGIENPYAQSALIFGVVFAVLIVGGTSVFKAINKIIGKT